MSEGLISRVRRLVSGSVNDLVDTIENAAPEAVMRETIREVDGAIEDVRGELGQVVANRHHANKRLMETSAKHEELAEKAAFAVDQGRDELAEAAIARQLDMEAQIPVLEATLKELSGKQGELEGYVSALLARKREMETDLQTYLASQAAQKSAANGADGADATAKGTTTAGRVDRAESTFQRVMHGASGIGATVASDADTAAKLAELEQVARTHRVQERLAALKATKETI